jgi:PAS domain S-box-containing protein
VLLGAVTLAGWSLGLRGLTTPVADTYATQPMTAVSLMLGGTALLGSASRVSALRKAALLLAGIVFVVGMLSLIQNALHVDLRSDRWLFSQSVLSQPVNPSRWPGRMASPTAATLVLFAAAVVSAACGDTAYRRFAAGAAWLGMPALLYAVGAQAAGTLAGTALPPHGRISLFGTVGCALLLVGALLRARTSVAGAAPPVPSLRFRRVATAALTLVSDGTLWFVAAARSGAPDVADARFAAGSLVALTLAAVAAVFGGVRMGRVARRQVANVGGLPRVERALMLGDFRFRELADALPQPVWIARSDGSVDYFNQRWHDYVGRPPAASEGQGWVAFVHPEDRDRLREEWTRAVAGSLEFENESRLRGRDGRYRWFLTRAVPFTADAESHRWFGSCTDIHEQRQAAEGLQAADRRKDVFLATLAHELRNPLAPIRNALHVLGLGELGKDQFEWARRVLERQTSAISRLLDDLLDVVRINENKLELRSQQVDLARALDQGIEVAQPLVSQKNHTLRVSLPETPLVVTADPTRLSQIVGNLLNNAAKYTDPGGTIDLSARSTQHGIEIRVKDSGIGLTADARRHIFEMFAQTEGAEGRSEGGLGIGLALVKGLVDLHGGTVEAFSAGPCRGSEFVVTLPVPVTAPSADPADASAPPQAAGARILIVDDNRDAAHSLAMVLRLAKHDVRLAFDGRSALSIAAAARPEVAIIDIGLPDLSGNDVARSLRRADGSRDVLLIALTGWGEDRRRALDVGFDYYFMKPADPVQLEALIAGHQVSRRAGTGLPDKTR